MDEVKPGQAIAAAHINELRREVEANTIREGIGYRIDRGPGGTALVIASPRGSAACSALAVGLDDAGDFTQPAGVVNSTGQTATGYTGVPTLIDGDTAGASTTIIYLELDFDAVTSGSEDTEWELSASRFDTGTSVPSESVPAWGGSSWDKTSFSIAEAWATYDDTDTVITSTRCGSVTVIFCSLNDIRMIAPGANG